MATAIGIKVLSLFSGIFEGAIKVADIFTGKGKDTDDHSWQKPGPTDRKDIYSVQFPCYLKSAEPTKLTQQPHR